jgi:DNA-binding transcriptional LysR family regulator
VETALGKACIKIKSFKNVIELDSTQAIKSAVEAGLGVGFVPSCSIHKEIELHALKIVEVKGLRIHRNYFVVSLMGPELSGPEAAFRAFALDRARHISAAPGKSVRSAGLLR